MAIIISRRTGGGIRKLSELEIDIDKGWAGHSILDLRGISSGHTFNMNIGGANLAFAYSDEVGTLNITSSVDVYIRGIKRLQSDSLMVVRAPELSIELYSQEQSGLINFIYDSENNEVIMDSSLPIRIPNLVGGGGGGITKLSELEIDADKGWNGKSITNFGNLSGEAIEISTTSGDIVLNPASGQVIQNIPEENWGAFIQNIPVNNWGALMLNVYPEAEGEIIINPTRGGNRAMPGGVDIGYYYGYENHDSDAWLTLYAPKGTGVMGLYIDVYEASETAQVDIYGRLCTLNIGADDDIILYTSWVGGGSIILNPGQNIELNPMSGKIIFPKDEFHPTFLRYGEGAGLPPFQGGNWFVIDVETSCDIAVKDELTLRAFGGAGEISINADHDIYITVGISGNICLDPRGVVEFNHHQATSFVLHQWTTDTRPTNHAEGQIGYNTTTKRLEYWDGTTWKEVATL